MVDFSKSGWRTFWRDEEYGDDVFLNEPLGLVGVDLSTLCSDHEKGTFCRRCLPRAIAAFKAARCAIDPEAPAQIRAVGGNEQWPYLASLYNPMVQKHQAVLRSPQAKRVSMLKTIISGTRPGNGLGFVNAGAYTYSSAVCDAAIVRGFSLRLLDASDDYRRRFRGVKVSIRIDTELVIDCPFLDFESGAMVSVNRPRPDKSECLFGAFSVDADGKPIEHEWIGYFIPNATRFEVSLSGVPGGGNTVQIESLWNLGEYTTRNAPKSQNT